MQSEATRSQTWLYLSGAKRAIPQFDHDSPCQQSEYLPLCVLTSFVELDLLSDNRVNTALAALSIIGLLTAALVQPTVGMLSDRTHTRLGPRYPYFILGSLATLILLMVLVNAQSWLVLLPVVAGVQVALNSVQSPLQAMIPDYVVSARMGLAASIKTVLELSGVVVSGGVVVAFLGTHTRPELAVVVVSMILFVSVFITFRTAPLMQHSPSNAGEGRFWPRVALRACSKVTG